MRILLILLSFFIIISCKNNTSESELISQIKKMEANKTLSSSDTLINSYLQFAELYPKHKYAIKFLFKAAFLNARTNKLERAVKIFEKIPTQYPDSADKSAEALISAGYAYQMLGDKQGTNRVFMQYLTKYKNHPRYKEIEQSLYFINLSAEQQDSVMRSRLPF